MQVCALSCDVSQMCKCAPCEHLCPMGLQEEPSPHDKKKRKKGARAPRARPTCLNTVGEYDLEKLGIPVEARPVQVPRGLKSYTIGALDKRIEVMMLQRAFFVKSARKHIAWSKHESIQASSLLALNASGDAAGVCVCVCVCMCLCLRVCLSQLCVCLCEQSPALLIQLQGLSTGFCPCQSKRRPRGARRNCWPGGRRRRRRRRRSARPR